MHSYMYHRLHSGGLENGLYRTVEGRTTILLHKEYPTVARYQRATDRKLSESADGRRRGAFDISIWDPAFIGEREHRNRRCSVPPNWPSMNAALGIRTRSM